MTARIQVLTETPVRDVFASVGILDPQQDTPAHLELFLDQAESVMEKVRESIQDGSLPASRGPEFQQLLVDACARVLFHPIVASNRYLQRFSQGVSIDQARHECQQFSVFALQFDVAQAKLVANAPTEEAYLERLQVLLNEKGIPYKDGFEGELTGSWNLATVHFSWMLNMARGLGLGFEDIGKIWLGLPGTQAFVEATFENYASIDRNTACGAAFAIENWAANGLWRPWIDGMRQFNEQSDTKIDLGYLTYHDLEEQHHSQATLDELYESFVEPWFDGEAFLSGAEKMLTDGVQAYYASQLESLPDKDDSWPDKVVDPPRFNHQSLPRIAQSAVPV